MPFKSNEEYNAWRRNRYHTNKEFNAKERARVKAQTDRKVKFLNDYKAAHPCVICGEREPVCLDFHHKDGEEKENGVTLMFRKNKLQTILKEIDKCVILCSNCHRKLHAGLITLE